MGRHRTDDYDPGYRAQQAGPSRRRSRGGRGRVLVPLAGAVALAVLLGVAAFVIFTRENACSGDKITLRVVASPDIEPAVTKVANTYNKTSHDVDGRCVEVAVTKESSAKTAAALAAGKAPAEVWVADSSLLVARLKASAEGVAVSLPEATASVASSPIVLAASAASAKKLEGTLQPSWEGMISAANVANPDGLAKKIRVLALDPQKNSAGLNALLAAAGAAQAAGTDNRALIGALKKLSREVVAEPSALLASLTVKSGQRVPIGVASEQSIWAHNAKKPDLPVVPLYPAEGTLSLDYPYVVTTPDAVTRKAAEDFAKELATEPAKKILRDYGFRTPDGKGGPALSENKGFSPKAPQALPAPDAQTVASMSQSWSRLNLGTRLLALLDISGTMALPVPGTNPPQTRMQVIAKTALGGLGIYDAKAEIGAWLFSTHLDGQGKDYREVVPVGPLGEPINGVLRKDRLAQMLTTVQAKPTGDTGLNDTIKAAYGQMVENYAEDKINVLLIFTDGAGNDDPDGGVGDREILDYLKKTYDPKRPVNILLIAFGPDAPKGKSKMDALAQATGGEAFIVENPLDVREVFLKGMERRLCAPNCKDEG
ncbi:substrate-binding domain-containing protein [Thermoactinospora rubra]|uniref:substrate-binding domain-containing protein n=1 Tax=Thermoactinospora rubra TaxID=1088767 RepID=UPI001F0ACA41|nr:substrate-binding domain-containing protein [Thermoactinospora rubra]